MTLEFRKIQCPFCNEITVDTQILPKETRYKTSRAAGRSVTVTYTTPEKIEILSGCSFCGKSKTQINDVLKGNKSMLDVQKRKKRLEDLKALGFSGVITKNKQVAVGG